MIHLWAQADATAVSPWLVAIGTGVCLIGTAIAKFWDRLNKNSIKDEALRLETYVGWFREELKDKEEDLRSKDAEIRALERQLAEALAESKRWQTAYQTQVSTPPTK